MHFESNLVVRIAGKIVNTVHSVKTKFDSTHIGSFCDIIVPLNCVVEYDAPRHTFLTAYTLNLFKSGDPVSVVCNMVTEAGINMGDVEIYNGYIWDFIEGMPTTIRCIDYLPILGHLKDFHFKKITLTSLVTRSLVGTGVELIKPTLDLNLVDITFRSISPWGILDYLKKGLGLNISLSGKQLFVNVASTTLNEVKFSSDRNVYYNQLQKPENVWQGYRVKAWFIRENGMRDSIELGDKEGHCTDVYFYKVAGGTPVHENLAREALIKLRQRKYSGAVGALLYPVVKLYDRIDYTDITYPDKSGKFVCTSLSHSIDDNGILVSMRWAFLLDHLNSVA